MHAGLLFFLLGLGLLPFTRRLLQRCTMAGRPTRPSWNGLHFLLVVLSSVGVLYVAGSLWLAAGGQDILDQLWVMALGLGWAAVLIVGLVQRIDARGLASLGLDLRGLDVRGLAGRDVRRAICVGLGAYGLSLPLLIGANILWRDLLMGLGIEAPLQEYVQLFARAEGVRLVLACSLAVVVLPFFEELVFRAFLQPLLVQRLGMGGGVVLTSLCFAFLHGSASAGPIFCLSLLLGHLYAHSGRILAPWVVHGLHNGLVLFLLFNNTDLLEKLN